MYCWNCGNELPDEARFCRDCGVSAQAPVEGQPAPDTAPIPVTASAAPVPPPSDAPVAATPPAPGPASTPPPPPVTFAAYAPPPPPPRRGGPSRGAWIAIACAGLVVIALAVALPLILLRDGDTKTVETIGVAPTTLSTTTTTGMPTTTAPPTTQNTAPPTDTTQAPTTTTAAPTTTTAKSAPPGDSPGRWIETKIAGVEHSVYEVALSDTALLYLESPELGDSSISAYLFGVRKTVKLPSSNGTTLAGLDIDGSLAVWWEAEGADKITAAHIYACRLPDGQRVEIASGVNVGYPQVANGVVTWIEGKPWATEPDDWYEYIIKGVEVDAEGRPASATVTLIDAGYAIGSSTGDAGWTYSLSDGFLAWEQQTASGAVPIGSYVLNLVTSEPKLIDSDAWRPSLYQDKVLFTRNGAEYLTFPGTDLNTLDAAGDFATAAPTYAAYFRHSQPGDSTVWSVVARGYTGGLEQTLMADTGDAPWFLARIAVSAHHIAFATNGTLHVFGWKGE